MAVITRLEEPEILRILKCFGFKKLLGFEPASEGIENTNYFIQAARPGDETGRGGSYVLTLLEARTKSESPPTLAIQIQERCRNEGLPAPLLIPSTKGGFWVWHEGKPALLAERVPGEHVKQASRDHCTQIGNFLARFHRATNSLGATAVAYARDQSWLGAKAESALPRLPWSDRCLLGQELQHARSMLKRRDIQALPRGVIHGDLFRDNALFAGGSLRGVLDFHDAGKGYLIYDLSVAINDWCRAEGLLDPKCALSMLFAYHRIRSLNVLEMSFLHGFLRYAALSFWLSRLEVLPDALPRKDPEEFRGIILRHLRSPWMPRMEDLDSA